MFIKMVFVSDDNSNNRFVQCLVLGRIKEFITEKLSNFSGNNEIIMFSSNQERKL